MMFVSCRCRHKAQRFYPFKKAAGKPAPQSCPGAGLPARSSISPKPAANRAPGLSIKLLKFDKHLNKLKFHYFRFPKHSIKLDIAEIIQEIAITTKAILQPIETSATKIKVYNANMLNSKQIIVVIALVFVRLSIIEIPSQAEILPILLSFWYLQDRIQDTHIQDIQQHEPCQDYL